MFDDIYAILSIFIALFTIYIAYRYRRQVISIKQFFIAIFFAFLYLIVGGASITLCYNNPIMLIIETSLLAFIIFAFIEPKQIRQSMALGIFLVFIALSIYFRSFVKGSEFTTSAELVRFLNKRQEDKKTPYKFVLVKLWHTPITNIYKIKKTTSSTDK
jgi:hypothetical protein